MAKERSDRKDNREEKDSEFTDKLVHINRVAKVVKGGSALVSQHLLLLAIKKAASVLVTVKPVKFLKQCVKPLKVQNAL